VKERKRRIKYEKEGKKQAAYLFQPQPESGGQEEKSSHSGPSCRREKGRGNAKGTSGGTDLERTKRIDPKTRDEEKRELGG